MVMSPAFIRSLLLTSTFSFASPLVLIGIVLALLSAIAQIPLMTAIAQVAAEKLLQFLAVFGSGDSFQGALVIGLTCGLVGALFDAYAFYRHQNLRDS
ncbi:hypothetical protein [Stenomitos frigidus]|uniref:Uncharacterized protein n=2 Tax=Stenomitos TaxID=1844270 RepID=A0A2T1E0M1_9CYAN|nr:hypothetical protein C7B82_20235 [Stenomitos frigidus ULC18]